MSIHEHFLIELQRAAESLETRLDLLNAPGHKIPLADWDTLDSRTRDLVPEWLVTLLGNYRLAEIVLEFRNLEDNRPWPVILSLFRPATFVRDFQPGSLYLNLIDSGFFPFAWELDGNVWLTTVKDGPSGTIYLLEQSAWDGSMPHKDNGLIYAHRNLACLLSCMAISNETFEGDARMWWPQSKKTMSMPPDQSPKQTGAPLLDRVPCKICGANILLATAKSNEGLCGRCAKGHRPCVYCGKHVSEPLNDGLYAHMECWIRNRDREESLGWKKVEDIDWTMIRNLLRSAATRLFQRVAPERQATDTLTLEFFIRVEDFIDVTVLEVEQNGSSKRFSDEQWDKDLSPLGSSFLIMSKGLSEQDSIAASEIALRTLTSILSDECNKLAKENFYFPHQVQVSYRIESA